MGWGGAERGKLEGKENMKTCGECIHYREKSVFIQ